MLVKPTTVNFLRLFAVCGRARSFLRLLADRILNSLHLELLALKAQFNFFLPLACSYGARTSCATSCACIIFGLYCMFKKNLSKGMVDSTFSVFHNNIASISRNLKNVSILLDELDFSFNVIGITETKITISNENNFHPSIPGYVFEYVPTPLASGGVGLFVDQSLHYTVLEKTSYEAFQAIWIEISFVNHKNIVCGIIYRQHNSPEYFQSYFEEVIEKMVSDDKTVYIMGDFNIDLLKCETSQISQDFLLSLQSCYLIPTVDKPTRVYRASATLIDNIFVNNSDKLLASGNIISDISDHFSQFCITTSPRDKKQQIKSVKMRDYSNFPADSFAKDLLEVDWDRMIANGANCPDKLFSTF